MAFILLPICLFLIVCALYGISSGVNVVLRLFSRAGTAHAGTTGAVAKATEQRAAADGSAADDALGRCVADLNRLFELQQCGALTRHEFEALKHHLIKRVASAT